MTEDNIVFFEIFPWDKNFETGIDLIDEQHKQLVHLLNKLAAHLANHSDDIVMNDIFSELADYADYHFKSEEAIWDKHFGGDDWNVDHHKTHTSFIEQVVEIKNNKDNKSLDEVLYETVSFLSKWLAYHILDSDKRLAIAVKNMMRGVDIEKAKSQANEEMSGSMKVIVNTVLSMYDTLSTRTLDLMREKTLRIETEKALEKEEKVSKLKDEFIANISHELRTPLNAIIGFSGILTNKQSDPKHRELSKQISVGANSLLGLINSILDLEKIKNNELKLEPLEFEFYDRMRDLSSAFEIFIGNKTLHINNVVSNELKGLFFGDWLRISQIILNLVSNAIKFTPNDGEIKINSDYEDNSLVITISDNGIGMSDESIDQIFKPFTQVDGSRTRKYGGTGLGLSITQGLVELMNAKLELKSEEGVGTKFTITIPMDRVKTEEDQVNTRDAQESLKTPLGVHVLVAEDNKTNQMLIEMLLEEFGMTCDMANDGLEALDMYDPETHKMILMDEDMPNMNGTESMRRIREKYRDKCGSIIAVTASSMAGDREKFLEAGMDGYVPKPIDEDILYETIKELLV